MIIKKYYLRIILLLILILSGIIAGYSLSRYNGYISNNSVEIDKSLQNKRQNVNEIKNNYSVRKKDKGVQEKNEINQKKDNLRNLNVNPIPRDSHKYAIQIVIYFFIFIFIFMLFYYLINNKGYKIHTKNISFIVFILLGIGFLLRLASVTLMEGFTYDIVCFKKWASVLSGGFTDVYKMKIPSDYPPLYMYILLIIGKIASFDNIGHYYVVLLKLPSIIADVATACIVFRVAKKYITIEMSILLSIFYVFNPAVFINSTLWGQVDSFFTLIIVLALFKLTENKIVFSSILFSIAVLMKPQGIIFLPILFFELFRKRNLKDIIKSALSCICTAIIIVLPFALKLGPLWIFRLYLNTMGEYKFATLNAFNLFQLLGANFQDDSETLFIFSYYNWGMISICLITLFSWLIYIKSQNSSYIFITALLLFAGVFTFSSRMHERYIFTSVALAILSYIYIRDNRLLVCAFFFSITSYVNTHIILYENSKVINSVEIATIVTMIISTINIFLFGYIIKILYDNIVKKKMVQINFVTNFKIH
ncbi:DUF2029 domain-containing protein [Pseudobacteroides cellulosolvens]|uniref:Glycosyltransferase RgtA/B/C/D-like domain-containing protein n=1 Tax=Pseudobacteroides cellulosolvens ATCC 35603 = DSM 2933 TaxID=398512 RepID=A0A0L6JQZ7_9FIRM|nr:DUF2029 domain-containing protein [Pseudobacteroides cellulosolvens]KNY28198.1 Protein of unknown function DUF2029 [Pseudobacteroides cellulosolvens ATCC 35603 = DSM 2933]